MVFNYVTVTSLWYVLLVHETGVSREKQ